jgi:hypothetical protein
MASEAVMAVGGLVVRPPGRHQHAGLAQHVQQRIAPQARTGLLQRLRQQMVQLARAQPGLAQAHFSNEFDHGVGARTALLLMLQLLVVGLAADAPMAASPRHAQPREELLREDLPEGFFTMRTP